MIPVNIFYDNNDVKTKTMLSDAGYTSVDHYFDDNIDARYHWCVAHIDKNDFLWLLDKVWFTRETDAVLFKLSC